MKQFPHRRQRRLRHRVMWGYRTARSRRSRRRCPRRRWPSCCFWWSWRSSFAPATRQAGAQLGTQSFLTLLSVSAASAASATKVAAEGRGHLGSQSRASTGRHRRQRRHLSLRHLRCIHEVQPRRCSRHWLGQEHISWLTYPTRLVPVRFCQFELVHGVEDRSGRWIMPSSGRMVSSRGPRLLTTCAITVCRHEKVSRD